MQLLKDGALHGPSQTVEAQGAAAEPMSLRYDPAPDAGKHGSAECRQLKMQR